MEDFTSYSQRDTGVQKNPSSDHWCRIWLSYPGLEFSPPSRTKIAWISSWPSTHTVYLRSDAEGADILPKDLMSCWLTEWVFIIVELQFSMCFERLIDNGKSSINSRVLAGPWWFVLHLRYFHITPGISSGNAFVDVLTASLSSNLQGTDNYCCGGSLPLRQAKIWMQVWNCSQGKLYLSCIIRG